MDSASQAMEKLLAATIEHDLELQTDEGTSSTSIGNTAICARSSFSSSSTLNSKSRFHLDGQPILAPLMTASKVNEMQMARQMAMQIEARLTATAEADATDDDDEDNSSMEGRRSFPKLEQTKTYIYDSTQRRPQSLAIRGGGSSSLPIICVNPPTPLQPNQQQDEEEEENQHHHQIEQFSQQNLPSPQRKVNKITNRILHFERTGLGRAPKDPTLPATVVWQGQDKRILRSSTSPSLAIDQLDKQVDQLEVNQLQRSRSFTLEEPSQVLVEHMQRRAAATAATASQPPIANFQRDTIESKAKKVQRSTPSPNRSSHRQLANSSPSTRQQHLETLLEQALSEAGTTTHQQLNQAKHRMINDIKSAHRERFQKLVQYQHKEQLRMQQEFERQQKFLIDEICAEINVSAYAKSPKSIQVSEYTSTGDLKGNRSSDVSASSHSPTNTIALSSATTPRSFGELDEFLSMESTCRLPSAQPPSSAPPSQIHSTRKRLFNVEPNQNFNYDSDPQSLPLGSSPSTPRSLPLRNSSISNSNRRPLSGPGQIRTQSPMRRVTKKPIVRGESTVRTTKVSPTNTAASRKNSSPVRRPQQQQHPQRSVSKPRKVASPNRTTQEVNDMEKHLAACRITAAVKGYLVRRLFRTEQVQRVVQTIRDTLIFVLNLHLETYGSSLEQEEPANIRLKARLLQQLCSASRTLHLIFFQTTVKERMEIIARDRKRIKTKLMAMHLKRRQ
ncbi:uncharacterized protein LOC6649043 isoform X1 [Drosophila willistoni]|uniref:uncharacterized protein LOC6649043 isoform X1 n=1 Tax=Drosophila willistoni TaxID=7260 RepID=UPI000C26C3D3|nr:uncharacterized protein LOC6649043 isoform X1 [Drosophila willistoni]